MREKYESLSLATLKDLAKARGLKGISTMKKAELIERMLEEDEKEKKLTLYIGNRVGDDRYVMLNDSKIVYLVSDAICGNILNEEE